MVALEECHARGFLWKSIGMCNEVKREVNQCLRAQRMEHIAQNREKARARQERVNRAWQEVDAES